MAAQIQPSKMQLTHREVPRPNGPAEATGRYLVDNNKYFWLDNRRRLGVELYARALEITWGSSPEYWTYVCEKIPNTDYTVEVAKLSNVCWLDVMGEFDTRKLTGGCEYEILFDMELARGAYGWSFPVNFEHTVPSGSVSKFEMKLDHLIGQGRAQIPIGRFVLPCVPIGTPNAAFRMYEHVGGEWKNGLIVRGVVIKPVQEEVKGMQDIPICSSF